MRLLNSRKQELAYVIFVNNKFDTHQNRTKSTYTLLGLYIQSYSHTLSPTMSLIICMILINRAFIERREAQIQNTPIKSKTPKKAPSSSSKATLLSSFGNDTPLKPKPSQAQTPSKPASSTKKLLNASGINTPGRPNASYLDTQMKAARQCANVREYSKAADIYRALFDGPWKQEVVKKAIFWTGWAAAYENLGNHDRVLELYHQASIHKAQPFENIRVGLQDFLSSRAGATRFNLIPYISKENKGSKQTGKKLAHHLPSTPQIARPNETSQVDQPAANLTTMTPQRIPISKKLSFAEGSKTPVVDHLKRLLMRVEAGDISLPKGTPLYNDAKPPAYTPIRSAQRAAKAPGSATPIADRLRQTLSSIEDEMSTVRRLQMQKTEAEVKLSNQQREEHQMSLQRKAAAQAKLAQAKVDAEKRAKARALKEQEAQRAAELAVKVAAEKAAEAQRIEAEKLTAKHQLEKQLLEAQNESQAKDVEEELKAETEELQKIEAEMNAISQTVDIIMEVSEEQLAQKAADDIKELIEDVAQQLDFSDEEDEEDMKAMEQPRQAKIQETTSVAVERSAENSSDVGESTVKVLATKSKEMRAEESSAVEATESTIVVLEPVNIRGLRKSAKAAAMELCQSRNDTILSPVRRSGRRYKAQSMSRVQELLKQTNYAYSPNPDLANLTPSKATPKKQPTPSKRYAEVVRQVADKKNSEQKESIPEAVLEKHMLEDVNSSTDGCSSTSFSIEKVQKFANEKNSPLSFGEDASDSMESLNASLGEDDSQNFCKDLSEAFSMVQQTSTNNVQEQEEHEELIPAEFKVPEVPTNRRSVVVHRKRNSLVSIKPNMKLFSIPEDHTATRSKRANVANDGLVSSPKEPEERQSTPRFTRSCKRNHACSSAEKTTRQDTPTVKRRKTSKEQCAGTRSVSKLVAPGFSSTTRKDTPMKRKYSVLHREGSKIPTPSPLRRTRSKTLEKSVDESSEAAVFKVPAARTAKKGTGL